MYWCDPLEKVTRTWHRYSTLIRLRMLYLFFILSVSIFFKFDLLWELNVHKNQQRIMDLSDKYYKNCNKVDSINSIIFVDVFKIEVRPVFGFKPTHSNVNDSHCTDCTPRYLNCKHWPNFRHGVLPYFWEQYISHASHLLFSGCIDT